MARKQLPRFSPKHFFEKVGKGKTLLTSLKKDILFSQGDSMEAIFYIQKGQVKLSVVSQQGKEAVVAMLGPGAFLGEGCLAGQLVCMATATTTEDSTLVRIEKRAMIDALQRAHLRRTVPDLSPLSQHSHPRGSGGSTLQFE